MIISPIPLRDFDAEEHLNFSATYGLDTTPKYVEALHIPIEGDTLLLYVYNTVDKGRLPVWFAENNVSSFPYVDFLARYEKYLLAVGIKIVEQGRPDLVVDLPYAQPYYHSRYYKKTRFSSIYCTEFDEECIPLIANSMRSYRGVGDDVAYIGGVPKNICSNHIYKTYECGELVAVSILCEYGDEWYWCNTYRKNVNMEMLIINLMNIAEMSGAKRFNLGVDFFPYKHRFKPTLRWQLGLEFIRP